MTGNAGLSELSSMSGFVRQAEDQCGRAFPDSAAFVLGHLQGPIT
jgi:hypothetical protein